jgi:phosphatidylserine decarboxylase
MNIAKGGLSWIAVSYLATFLFIVVSYLVSGPIKYVSITISALLLIISFTLVIFFRDPKRKTGTGVVAVADGVIREITDEDDNDVGKCTKISTFMNIHNVHVNRMPLDGKILDVVHYDGAHLPAFKKESERNERVIFHIKTDMGRIKVIQIAGTLARRIVPYIKKGDAVKKGEKIGIIRLGSRVDIYLPTKKIQTITVNVKDRVNAGEDTIAKIHD